VQAQPQPHAEAPHVARVLGDLGMDERDVEPGLGSTSG